MCYFAFLFCKNVVYLQIFLVVQSSLGLVGVCAYQPRSVEKSEFFKT